MDDLEFGYSDYVYTAPPEDFFPLSRYSRHVTALATRLPKLRTAKLVIQGRRENVLGVDADDMDLEITYPLVISRINKGVDIHSVGATR